MRIHNSVITDFDDARRAGGRSGEEERRALAGGDFQGSIDVRGRNARRGIFFSLSIGGGVPSVRVSSSGARGRNCCRSRRRSGPAEHSSTGPGKLDRSLSEVDECAGSGRGPGGGRCEQQGILSLHDRSRSCSEWPRRGGRRAQALSTSPYSREELVWTHLRIRCVLAHTAIEQGRRARPGGEQRKAEGTIDERPSTEVRQCSEAVDSYKRRPRKQRTIPSGDASVSAPRRLCST